MKDKLKAWYIHIYVLRKSKTLAKITVKFLMSVEKFCKRNALDYNKTLCLMLEKIIKTELIENAN